MTPIATVLATVAILASCDRPAAFPERGAGRSSETTGAAPGAAMTRFRAGLDSPAHLDGPAQRDELVRQFFAALRRADRDALQRLAVTRGEFAYLVFPYSMWVKPPYNQPPDLEWELLTARSESGLTRLLQRATGVQPLSYTCNQPPEKDGPVTYWPNCLVRLRDTTGHISERKLFGSIMEVGGRYKFRDFNNAF